VEGEIRRPPVFCIAENLRFSRDLFRAGFPEVYWEKELEETNQGKHVRPYEIPGDVYRIRGDPVPIPPSTLSPTRRISQRTGPVPLGNGINQLHQPVQESKGNLNSDNLETKEISSPVQGGVVLWGNGGSAVAVFGNAPPPLSTGREMHK